MGYANQKANVTEKNACSGIFLYLFSPPYYALPCLVPVVTQPDAQGYAWGTVSVHTDTT